MRSLDLHNLRDDGHEIVKRRILQLGSEQRFLIRVPLSITRSEAGAGTQVGRLNHALDELDGLVLRFRDRENDSSQELSCELLLGGAFSETDRGEGFSSPSGQNLQKRHRCACADPQHVDRKARLQREDLWFRQDGIDVIVHGRHK